MPESQRVPFDLLIFDWDGPAVPDRRAPIPELLSALEQVLTNSKLTCVIVTGTNVEHLMKQGLEQLSTQAKLALYICTNRGSEAWGFDKNGRLISLHRREATPEENAALDRSIMHLQSDIAKQGLNTKVISQRLNRRKLDLIPDPLWASPKKAQFRELLAAVTLELREAGIERGLSTLIADAYRFSHAEGLKSPRIITDIKHIEIGLTDKSDSAKWAFDRLITEHNIPVSRVAVIGDEIGPIGGIVGSDALLHIPELEGAEFISVGVEPDGVPAWVHQMTGGPRRFVQFLCDQIVLHKVPEEITLTNGDHDLAWTVIQEGFEPSRDREMETLFTIGNGYLGIRASTDFPLPTAQSDLFIAGVYDRKATSLPYSEVEFHTTGSRTSLETEIVPFPSPFQFKFSIEGQTLSSVSDATKTRNLTLNLKEGLYSEEHVFEDSLKRSTEITSSRYASLLHPNLIFQKLCIRSKNYAASLEVEFSDAFSGLPSLHPHLDPVHSESNTMDSSVDIYQTRGSHVTVAIASRIFLNGIESPSTKCSFHLNAGESAVIQRIVSVYTSRDTPAPKTSACDRVSQFSFSSFESEHQSNRKAWALFWSKSDLDYGENLELTQAQRFNLYHLRIAAGNDPKTSIPAKGLTGRAYEGHIFWDAEIFMFPFLLYTEPDLAKNLLLYRFNTLEGAKTRARALGYQGACYAWESTLSGADFTPKSILISNTKQEILIETARFWLSRSSPDGEPEGILHINAVMGPDEYHHDVQDNAYTNWMARFNLEQAAWAESGRNP